MLRLKRFNGFVLQRFNKLPLLSSWGIKSLMLLRFIECAAKVSGQRLENVNITNLVLDCGDLVLQKALIQAILVITMLHLKEYLLETYIEYIEHS